MKNIIALMFLFSLHALANEDTVYRLIRSSNNGRPEEYREARKKFLALARLIRNVVPDSQIESTPVVYEDAPDLFIDSIFIPAKNGSSKNLVILTSGIHGVEAPAGNYQERLFLLNFFDQMKHRYAPLFDHEKTSVLVIHSMNPYGFKYGRRFNGNNVDLNRNCFDDREVPFPGRLIENASYEKMKHLFEKKISALDVLIQGAFERENLTHALAGQYIYPKGFYFGGQEVQQECSSVQKIMDQHIQEARNILHIDFHTGLGKRGVSQIMLNLPPTEGPAVEAYKRELRYAKEVLFPEAFCGDVCEVQPADPHGFVTTGDITQFINARYPEKRLQGLVLSVTSEIGTVGPLKTLPVLVNENFCHTHPDECKQEEVRELTQKLKETFNPTDSKWQRRVEEGGQKIWEALAKFSKL